MEEDPYKDNARAIYGKLEGTFDKWNASQQECPKCKKHNVLYREWESSDGGYEDYQYKCQNPSCGHSWWVDGVDS